MPWSKNQSAPELYSSCSKSEMELFLQLCGYAWVVVQLESPSILQNQKLFTPRRKKNSPRPEMKNLLRSCAVHGCTTYAVCSKRIANFMIIQSINVIFYSMAGNFTR
ncbi:unnamed protein product [Acanthoscelides obtectus]|uniref:Uncharacterized protein n=1 Tax=Acanthoscelides obtectus TaxID=200917 RepID=A0A9P0K5Z2_ACAOB|nr:unnamed protein product [Acanthoscelides obtectus]CAK1631147.1 hypothetical protein AOBTE_LOCUS6783 [Acanthoscelides obtectus]